jgi:hypothetical protein
LFSGGKTAIPPFPQCFFRGFDSSRSGKNLNVLSGKEGFYVILFDFALLSYLMITMEDMKIGQGEVVVMVPNT